VTGNVTGGNILNNGLISSTGNSTAANYLTGGLISATGNVTGGNVLTGGLSISGNVIGNILPAANITYDLGSNTQRWRDLWLSNSTIYLGNSTISANATAIVMTNPAGGQTVLAGASGASQITGAIVSATGNVTGGNILTAGLISATGNITGGNLSGTSVAGTLTTAAQTNITSVGTLGSLAVTANVTGGNIRTAGLVSATGNITGNYFIGNGSQLTGITATSGAGNLWVVGRIATYYVPIISGILTVVGRTGNISIAINA
jgi:hypothetical protein